MVTTSRKLVSIDLIKQLQEEGMTAEEIVKHCARLEPRHKNPPPPPGTLCIGAASRKYNIQKRTISRWVEKGLIPITLQTWRYKYINEAVLAEKVKEYKADPGQGKQTLRKKSAAVS